MKTKTNVKAGRITGNHNETMASGLCVRMEMKASGVRS
jgi:hypothetical protein